MMRSNEEALRDLREALVDSLDLLIQAVHENKYTVFRLPAGFGKSSLVDELLNQNWLFEKYDLVLYGTSRTGVLNERKAFEKTEK